MQRHWTTVSWLYHLKMGFFPIASHFVWVTECFHSLSKHSAHLFHSLVCVFSFNLLNRRIKTKIDTIHSESSVIIPPRNMYEQRRVPLLVRNKSKSELIRYYHHCIYFPTFRIRALNKIMSFESITSWFRIRFFSIFLEWIHFYPQYWHTR